MYMPGRRRTGSSPCRTVMWSALYCWVAAMSGQFVISVEQLALRRFRRLGRRHRDDLRALGQRMTLAPARRHVEPPRADRQLLAAFGLGDDHVARLLAAQA